MFNLPLYDSHEDVPAPRARADVRFDGVALTPLADGRRVKLSFRLTPFLERPSVDVRVVNPAGDEVASMSLIEAMDTAFDFTLHLRGPEPRGEHTAHLTLFYPLSDDAPTDARQVVAEAAVTFTAASPF